MNLQLIIGFVLTVLPVTELRVGLPVILEYALRNNISVWPLFVLVILLNISVIFLLFFFFDFLHKSFMKLKPYKKVIEYLVKKTQSEVKEINHEKGIWKYALLMFFVAIPLPGTGAWTGSFIAWAMKLNRLKSIIAISLGVFIAGLLVLFASLGVLSLF